MAASAMSSPTASFTISASRIDAPTISDVEFTRQASPILGEDKQLGVITLTAPHAEIRKGTHNIIFSCDRSGSMSSFDGSGIITSTSKSASKSPMDFLKHTLHNIFQFVATLSTTEAADILITVLMFDHEVQVPILHQRMTPTNCEEMYSHINPIQPRGGTDISAVLRQANKYLIPRAHNTHILMTDGEPTLGITYDMKRLCSLLNEDFSYAFIGYGQSHNASILNTLASKHNSPYYMVDNFENAGMVYGEILHSILYCKFDEVKLRVDIEGARLFNPRKNAWVVQEMQLGSFASEETRSVYVMFDGTSFNEYLHSHREDNLSKMIQNVSVSATSSASAAAVEDDTEDPCIVHPPQSRTEDSCNQIQVFYKDVEDSRVEQVQGAQFASLELIYPTMDLMTLTQHMRTMLAHYLRFYTIYATSAYFGTGSTMKQPDVIKFCLGIQAVLKRVLAGGKLLEFGASAVAGETAAAAAAASATTTTTATSVIPDSIMNENSYDIMVQLKDDLLITLGAIRSYGMARWYSQIYQRAYNLHHIPVECYVDNTRIAMGPQFGNMFAGGAVGAAAAAAAAAGTPMSHVRNMLTTTPMRQMRFVDDDDESDGSTSSTASRGAGAGAIYGHENDSDEDHEMNHPPLQQNPEDGVDLGVGGASASYLAAPTVGYVPSLSQQISQASHSAYASPHVVRTIERCSQHY